MADHGYLWRVRHCKAVYENKLAELTSSLQKLQEEQETWLLEQCAILYYQEQMTQVKIGELLSISQTAVSRFIKQARKSGFVIFTVHMHDGTTITSR